MTPYTTIRHANSHPLSIRPKIQFASCVALALLGLSSPVRLSADVIISPDIAYYFGDGPGEGLSVSSNGKNVLVSSPKPLANAVFISSVPNLHHRPRHIPEPFELLASPSLPGEVTDVAVVPHRKWGLAVVRSDPSSSLNALLVLNEGVVAQTLPIPESPDGMKVSPSGRYAIVAVEKGGEIRIYDLQNGPTSVTLVALVTRDALAAHFVGVPNPVNALEPEAVSISPDSSSALVTLQDCSSVAALDLNCLGSLQNQNLPPESVGNVVLKSVTHLPFGFIGNNGSLQGVEPDGVGISPDGSYAIVANEANQRAKHLQGISVLKLSDGLENITAQTFSLFDIDPTLLQNTGLAAAPIVAPGAPYPTAANALPRLDPASVEIVERGDQVVAALVIERYDPSAAQFAAAPSNESRGSVLFLSPEDPLNGGFNVIGRNPVGAAGARLEVVDSAQEGRWIFVSISNGGSSSGTIARLELVEP